VVGCACGQSDLDSWEVGWLSLVFALNGLLRMPASCKRIAPSMVGCALRLLCLACAIFCTTLAAQEAAANAALHQRLGIQYLNSREFDKAREEFQAALRLEPDVPQTHNDLGLALVGKGDLDAALRSSKVGHTETVLHIGEGLKAMANGNLKEAVHEFQLAVRSDPSSPEAHNHLGVALAKTGDTEGAMTEFKKALDVEPQNATAYSNLGGLLASKGNIDAAVAQLEEAIKIKANLAEAHYNLALLLRQQGQQERSAEEFTKAHELDPTLNLPASTAK
jgi:Flp pilus assembly protein TadD